MGSRNAVYKTSDGGTTWTSINPFPALNDGPTGFPNARITYTGISTLNDNTVFVTGNMFTDQGVKRVYKTTDAGTTWTDITGNLPALLPVGNITNVLFSDVNNGYVVAGNVLFVTNNSGASWTMEVAPHGNIHNALGFAPRTVPAAIPFANRKLFIAGLSFGSGIPSIMEFGDTLNVNVNATTVIANATCSNLAAGSVTVNASGGLAPYTYSINGGAFQTSNTFTGLTQGVKTISIKDAFCGLTTKTVTVGFTDNLTIAAAPSDTSVCAGAPVQFRTTGTAATSYAWSPSAGLSNAAIANPVATTNSNRTYTLTATLNGCIKTSTVNITIKPNPVVNAGPDKTIVEGADVRLEGSGSSNSNTISWTPAATLSNANSFTPLAKPLVTTTYTLTVNNSEGCVSTDDATVTVIPYCVKIMNAFTPNGDAINDRWIVTTGAACTNQVMVKVFNRYGSEVYSNDNYKNDWDGNYKGKPVPDGTYYYTINFRLISGRVVPAKGDVTILR
jgi:gliding motility-associated-like protein